MNFQVLRTRNIPVEWTVHYADENNQAYLSLDEIIQNTLNSTQGHKIIRITHTFIFFLIVTCYGQELAS